MSKFRTDDVLHFTTSSSWFRYPECGKDGAIFLDSTIDPSKVTCLACQATEEYNKAVIRRLRCMTTEKVA